MLSVFVLKLSAQVTKGGGRAAIFNVIPMLIILYWLPKGGWPKYAPDYILIC